MLIPFGEYLPDLPAYENPGATVATNAIPQANFYLPVKAPSDLTSNALDAYCRGAIYADDKNGTARNYAGDQTKLYLLSFNSWSDATRTTGGAYATGAQESWRFARWDEDVIATNFSDDIQVITMGGANFAALGGTPPKARHIAAVRRFIVLGNVNDATDGLVPNRVHWSGIDDPTTWTVSASTQADYQDLKGSGGWVQGVVGGEYGVVFQEHAIWRMTYVGSPAIWQFDEVIPNRGCLAPNSICQVGNMIFYLAQDGFEMVENGSRSVPIGQNKVDRTFFADIEYDNIDHMTCAADVERRVVWWAYPGSGATSGRANKYLFYDWANQRWGSGSITTANSQPEVLYRSEDGSGFPALAIFGGDHKRGFFTGDNEEATLETAEIEPNYGQQTRISRVRPLVESDSPQMQLGTRNQPATAVAYASAVALTTSGDITSRSTARYHRFRVITQGTNWTQARGVQVLEHGPAGTRGRS